MRLKKTTLALICCSNRCCNICSPAAAEGGASKGWTRGRKRGRSLKPGCCRRENQVQIREGTFGGGLGMV